MKRTEFYFNGHKNISLFAQSWQNTQFPLQANLIVTHGHGEHSEWYSRLAEALVPRGYNLYAWDLQGYGQSAGKRGYIEDFYDHSLDLLQFIKYLKSSVSHFQETPFFLISHSMGGMITLKALIDHADIGQRATCLSSPLIDMATPPPLYKDLLARTLYHILPKITLTSGTRPDELSRDPQIIKLYKKDPLRTAMVSPGSYLGILKSSEYIKSNPHKITTPIFFQLAGNDKVVRRHTSEKVFDKISSKIKKKTLYSDAYHEIFNDICREQVFNDLHDFLQERLSQ